MWCNEGLEAVVPVPELDHEQAKMWETLGGPTQPDISHTIWALTLRARLNSHRFYEIYAITAVEGIEKDDIVEMFNNAPQEAADTMRRIGAKMFSNRAEPNRVKIT